MQNVRSRSISESARGGGSPQMQDVRGGMLGSTPSRMLANWPGREKDGRANRATADVQTDFPGFLTFRGLSSHSHRQSAFHSA